MAGRNNPRKPVDGQTEEVFAPRIDPFSLPQDANPETDERVPGELDDAGYYTYKTRSGKTYTIQPKPDQRTTRGKVEDWLGEGAPLPSAQEVWDVAKQMPEAIYGQVADSVRGEGTLGDAVGMAPGLQAAGATASVPKGALRMGGGRNTENPKYNPLVLERGSPPQRLYQAWKNMHEWDDSTEDWIKLKLAVEEVGGNPEEIVKSFRETPQKYGNNPVQAFEDWIDDSQPKTVVNQYSKFFEEAPHGWSFADGNELFGVVANFYNPLRNSLENLEFGKNGLRGETIAAHLEKRTPKARKALLRSIDSGKGVFDPKKRYSQKEALEIIDKNFGRVYAGKESIWRGVQRMNFLENKEKDYGEIVIRQERDTPFRAKGEQHYPDDTIAHARFSIRDDGAGGDMLVVEELQSDLVQKGYDTDVFGRPGISFAEAAYDLARKENLPKVYADVISVMDRKESDLTEARLWEVVDELDKHLGIPGQSRKTVEFFQNNKRGFLIRRINLFVHNANEDFDDLWGKAWEISRKNTKKDPVSLPPVESTTDFVRPLIHSLMREAKNRGVEKVVIPNSDAFLDARKGQLSDNPGEEEGVRRAFKQTYDNAVDKVLRELERERGVDVEVERINLKGFETPESIVDDDIDDDIIDDIIDASLDDEQAAEFFGAPASQNPAEKKNYPARMVTVKSFPEGQLRFAEGGLVEDQMKFAFMDGGMVDDGKTVEETTGNEIPPGSLDQEVADTVDAKLSEGEYVIPADVVQYFGVAHFEKMIEKAKKGLGEMEANGRIGGESPEDDELPFSDDELMVEDGSEESPQEFAEGGVVQGASPGIMTKVFVGPNGEELPVLFINGLPIQQIPQGYTLKGQAAPAKDVFKSVRSDDKADFRQEPQKRAIEEWAVEDFEKFADQNNTAKIASAAPALFGPGGMLLGGFIKKGYEWTGNKAIQEIDRRLDSVELDEQSRERLSAAKNQITSNQSDKSFSIFGEDSVLSNLFGGKPEEKKTTKTPASKPKVPAGIQTEQKFDKPGDRDQSKPFGSASTSNPAPTTSPRPQPRPTQEQRFTEDRVKEFAESGNASRGFAAGGLVKRRKKIT